MRERAMWRMTIAGLLAVVATGAGAPGARATDAVPPAEAAATSQAQQQANQTVENILKEQEALLSGQRFSYDPAGRRDPFRSLFEESAIRRKGPRPRGVAGMLVAEVDLTGIVRDSAGGNLAVFTGSDNKGYFMRVGDEVYDGTVIAIDPGSGVVTFRQQVDDPRLIKPYRDVVKRLVPVGEEKGNE